MGGACSTHCLGKECIETWRRHPGRQGHTQEGYINLLATDFFQILAHPVFKM